MRPADVEDVVRVIRLFDTDDAKHARPYFEWYAAEGGAPNHKNFVAEGNSGLLGIGGFEPAESEARGVYWISWFYVHPDHHGEGIGGQLMRTITRSLKAIGARKVYVDASAYESYRPAIRFYERHGFVLEATLKDYYAVGEDCLYLAKEVRQVGTGKTRR